MNTLTVNTRITKEMAVEVPIPFFARSKDEKNYIALLDENTVVKIYVNKGLTTVSNGEISLYSTELAEAWETFTSCTETEFLDKYDSVLASISLHPKLAV